MAEIRGEVLQFARNAVGKRIWARIRQRRARNLQTAVSGYTYRGNQFQCSDTISGWEQTTDHIILTDRSRRNNFADQDLRAYNICNAGVGECWDLAYAALAHNNGLRWQIANRATIRVWSNNRITQLRQMSGGEILELRGIFYIRMEQNLGWSWGEIANEHTAIAAGGCVNGAVDVYQQNFGGERRVHSENIILTSLSYNSQNRTVLQACGGHSVRQLILQARAAGRNAARLETVRGRINNYISSHQNQIPSGIKIYIPMSNT